MKNVDQYRSYIYIYRVMYMDMVYIYGYIVDILYFTVGYMGYTTFVGMGITESN